MRNIKDWDSDEFLGGIGLLFCLLAIAMGLSIFVAYMSNRGPWSPEAYELERKNKVIKLEQIQKILREVEKHD